MAPRLLNHIAAFLPACGPPVHDEARPLSRSILLPMLLAILAFHVCTIRSGHDWGGDFSQYLQHAKNLVEGRPYAATSYRRTPETAHLGPAYYPPGFPLLLAPIYRVWGLNFFAMKLLLVGFLVASLVLIHETFKTQLSTRTQTALILLVGLNPLLWDFKDQLLSDLPFLFFVFLALRLMQRAVRPASHPLLGMWLGIAIGLAYSTRSVGLALAPILPLCEFVARRRLSRASVLALTTLAVWIAAQAALLPGAGGYLSLFRLDPASVCRNVVHLGVAYSVFWDNGYVLWGRLLVYFCVLLLALVGYARQARRRCGPLELYPLFYLLPLCFWPFPQGYRLVIPLFPLAVGYGLMGLETLLARLDGRGRKAVIVAGVALLLATYLGKYGSLPFGEIPVGIERPAARELWSQLATWGEDAGTIVFRKPRVMALLSGLPTAGWPKETDDAALLEYLSRVRAGVVVVGSVFEEDVALIRPFLQRNQDRWELIFDNAEFQAYRIKS